MPNEGIGIVGLGRVEVLPVGTQVLHQWRLHLFQSHHYHLGNLPGTVWVEVGIVCQWLVLIRESIGRIVNQRQLRALFA